MNDNSSIIEISHKILPATSISIYSDKEGWQNPKKYIHNSFMRCR